MQIKNTVKKYAPGMAISLGIAIVAWILGQFIPVVGGAIFSIVIGMVLTYLIRDKRKLQDGIQFTSKKILQYAVILLGFGLDLNVIAETGLQSLPIILATITTSLIIAFVLSKVLHIPGKISTLIGVGSSICGGSAIAATAPVIKADDKEVAQSISVIFFFNVIAAILFPYFGSLLGFDTSSGNAFGIFAGTAINDTSSVTAAASTWDTMWNLGSATLDKAVTVKLTRTLAIIPITLILALVQMRKEKISRSETNSEGKFKLSKVFPFFILYFIGASIITTIVIALGGSTSWFSPFKDISKFFIIWAMAAIGLNTDIVSLVKTGGKPLLLGFCCWFGITGVSLLMQHIIGIW